MTEKIQIVRMKNAHEELGVSRSTVYRLVEAGKIHPINISPRTVGFTRAEINRFLASLSEF